MKKLVKNLMHTGLGFAVSAGEQVQDWLEDIIEKGKEWQDAEATENEEEEVVAEEENTTENQEVEATEEANEEEVEQENVEDKSNRWEEWENRIRQWVDGAVTRFNFIRNDEHERIEKRIEKLEERLSELAAAFKNEETTEEVVAEEEKTEAQDA